MKVETSLLLSEDLLCAIDKLSGQYRNRSEWIEMALRTFIAQITREIEVKDKEVKDIDIINKNSDSLNEEALDVLTYQVDL